LHANALLSFALYNGINKQFSESGRVALGLGLGLTLTLGWVALAVAYCTVFL